MTPAAPAAAAAVQDPDEPTTEPKETCRPPKALWGITPDAGKVICLMRVLFASSQGAGHFNPLIPWIEISRHRGHEVLVIGPPGLAETVERAGYPFRVGAAPSPEEVAPIWTRVATMRQNEVGPLVIGEIFCRLNSGAMLPVMRATCDDWAPDLVLRDPVEFASAVAAEERGIRQVRVGFGLAATEEFILDMSTPALESFRPGLARRIAGSEYLTLFPKSLDDSGFGNVRRYRLPNSAPTGALPDWWHGSRDPLIYITFGTAAPRMPGMVQAYRAALDAVEGLRVRVLLTVGRDLDPARFAVPARTVRIERWVDQAAAMADAALVVCHGGAGTTLGALAAGVPLVVLPLFADQTPNARCVAGAGAGLVVEARGNVTGEARMIEDADTPAIRDAIEKVLHNRSYTDACGQIAAAINELPRLDNTFDELVTSPRPPGGDKIASVRPRPISGMR